MKKKTILLLSLSVIALLFGVFGHKKTHKKSFSEIVDSKKENSLKKENKDVLNKKEIAKAKTITKKKISMPKRTIASIPSPLNVTQRQILGDKNVDLSKVTYINTVDPKWEEKLEYDLTRFHDKETKVIIKKEKGVIKVRNGKALLLEQVVVRYKFKDKETSYRALVNPENGDVVQTWDRSVHEDFRQINRFKVPI